MGPEAQPRERKSKPGVSLRLPLKITAVSWKDVAETLGPILLVSAIAILVALHYVRPAPPSTLTLSSGPEGSNFQKR
jgi:hypothetical protein